MYVTKIILVLDPKHGNIAATRKKIPAETRIESECGLSYETEKTGKDLR